MVPVIGSQIRTSPPSAEASQDPSGATTIADTPPIWPVRVLRAMPVARSQIRTSPSPPAEASQDPSGATTSADTPLVWPISTRDSAGWGRSGSAVMARRCGRGQPGDQLLGDSSGRAIARQPGGQGGGE